MLWFVVFILGSVLGVGVCLLVQFLVFKKWFNTLQVLTPPKRLQNNTFAFPKELIESINDPDLKNKKDTCLALNLLFQFLFRELRDTTKVRRWVMKRMDIEFLELLNTTTGKLLDSIVVRDFRLGDTLPVIKEASVLDIKLKDESFIEEMSLLVDLVYNGGFQLAVDVDMMFGKSAYVSVKVTKLIGRARLQMSRVPYTHWNFAFVEEPVLEFEAESQLDGRPMTQLTNLIINQLRRSVRKKHTLPYYKFRYKPFFTKAEPEPPAADLDFHGQRLSVGKLKVTVIQCSRLVTQSPEAFVYCTLAIDKMPWMELMSSRRHTWISYDCQVVKHPYETIGVTMKDEFVLDRYEEMVVVDNVVAKSSADLANIKKGDVVLSVNGLKVTDTRMAVRVIKQAPQKFKVRVERSSKSKSTQRPASEASQAIDFQYNEDNLSIKFDKNLHSGEEEFVNISFKPGVVDSVRDSEKNTGSDSDSSAVSFSLDTEGLRNRRKMNPDTQSVDVNQLTYHEKEEPVLKAVKSDPTLTLNRNSDSSDTASTISEGDVDLRRTKMVPAVRDPEFDEEFDFEVEDKHRYLNLCLWCRQPKKLDKQGRVLKQEKDVLLGHTSIPLMNIALECLSTLQGDMLTSYQLFPVNARNNSRSKVYPDLATHKGYDDNLCHGDVTLAFLHDTKALSKGERKRLLQMKRKNEEVAEQKAREATADRKHEESLKKLSTKTRSLPEGHHRFTSIKFTGATFCNFCHKKIWFKNGYKCEVCSLICHRKCTDKCQSQTICTDSGFKFKDPQAAVASAVKAAKQAKGTDGMQATSKLQAAVKQVKGAELLQANMKPSFFSRLRRGDKNAADKSKEAAETTQRPDLGGLPKQDGEPQDLVTNQQLRKRSNSLTDLTPTGSDADMNSFKGEGQDTHLHKTRSSSSLDELKNKSDDGSDAELERGMNLVRYYEQQKYTARSDEQVVTRAKEMGKELFSNLPPQERREKLDAMINKLQNEIDEESENRNELAKEEKGATTSRMKHSLKLQIEKSDERIQSLAVLMLHYCAGLQHCMEEIEIEKSQPPQQQADEQAENTREVDTDDDPFYESQSTTHSLENSDNQSQAMAHLELPVCNQSDQSLQQEESDDSLSDDEEHAELVKLRTEIEQQFIAGLDSTEIPNSIEDAIKSRSFDDSSLDYSCGNSDEFPGSSTLSIDPLPTSSDITTKVCNTKVASDTKSGSDTDTEPSSPRDKYKVASC